MGGSPLLTVQVAETISYKFITSSPKSNGTICGRTFHPKDVVKNSFFCVIAMRKETQTRSIPINFSQSANLPHCSVKFSFYLET